jgi:hypothetical protein
MSSKRHMQGQHLVLVLNSVILLATCISGAVTDSAKDIAAMGWLGLTLVTLCCCC